MADESIEDGEFWLPPQFLEDDDDHLACDDSDTSELSSPVDSATGSSSEDWSDEEDCLAKKMARSAIGDGVTKLDSDKSKGLFGSGSPKSTLRGVGGGEWGPRQRSPPLPATVQPLKSVAGFMPHQTVSQRQVQAAQLERMRRQQMIQRPMLFGQEHRAVHGGDPLDLQWPPLQPVPHQKNHHMMTTRQVGRPGAMRAVFVRPPGARPSVGTGVFLPRQAVVDSQPESRKKQGSAAGCRTVLIPAKVVQALKVSYESMASQPQKQQQKLQSFPNGRSASTSGNAVHSPKVTHFSPSRGPAEPRPVVNHEVQLPQEWTY